MRVVLKRRKQKQPSRNSAGIRNKMSFKVGDLVVMKPAYRTLDWHYGYGIITGVRAYPEENFASHRVQWEHEFSFHAGEELELVSAGG